MKSLIIFIFLNWSSFCFALKSKDYNELAHILIENQISKHTVLKLISETNKLGNRHVIEINGEYVLFKLSDDIIIFIKSISLFVLKYYKKNKEILPLELRKSLQDKNMNDIKIQISKDLCLKIISLME